MKTHLLLSTAILAAAFVFEGCKKKKKLETVVEGRVMTLGTNDPASTEPLEINLYSRAGGKGLGTGETLLIKGKTDKNGYFKFEFTAANDYTGHYLRILTDSIHRHRNETGNQYPIEIGGNQRRDIYLSPHAWLILHIKNVNPQPGDRIRLSRGGGVLYDLWGEVDIQKLELRHGNTDHVISYSIFRNNDANQYFDTVYLPAFDTTYYLLEY